MPRKPAAGRTARTLPTRKSPKGAPRAGRSMAAKDLRANDKQEPAKARRKYPSDAKSERAKGRPTKLTEPIIARIEAGIRAGNYLKTACLAAGVGYSTFARWEMLGRAQKRGAYRDFLERIEQAEAESEAALVNMWRGLAPDNWQAARDMLARRFPDRWGNRERLDIALAQKSDNDLIEYITATIRATNGGDTDSATPGANAEDNGGLGGGE